MMITSASNVLGSLVGLAVALTGCASGSGVPATTGATPDATADGGAFPVTIEHRFGATRIAEPPHRVVSLGFNDHDALLALGVTPVATRYWFGDEPHAVFPWARDELADAEPQVLDMPHGQLDYEAIAALSPDLISGVYAGLTEQEHARLSQIAPTITQTGEYIDFGMPWQEATVMVGRAVGQQAQAEQMVADVEARFTAVRKQHPEWRGLEVVVAGGPGEDFPHYSYVASEDPRSRVFRMLGFEVPDELDEIAGESFYATISLEQVELLDRDLLVFHQMQFVDGGRERILGEPLIAELDAVEDGRVIFVGGEVDDALQFSTVLSLPFVLDRLVPMIETAMDGEPATGPTPTSP